jgi:hypothetical protein
MFFSFILSNVNVGLAVCTENITVHGTAQHTAVPTSQDEVPFVVHRPFFELPFSERPISESDHSPKDQSPKDTNPRQIYCCQAGAVRSRID